MNAPSPSLPTRDHILVDRTAGPSRVIDSIRSFLALLWLDIKRSHGYWALPMMIGLGIYAPPTDHLPEIALWPEMSHATLQSYVVVGPLAAALAAWLVDRERRRRMGTLVGSLPGTGLRRDLLAFGTASFWGVAGYVAVAAWFCGQAALRATWGGPDLGLIATGVLAILVFAAIGVLVGRLIPSKFSPLLALVATFFLTVGADLFKISHDGGGYSNPIRLLMPFGLTRVSYPNVFYRENDGFAGPVALWMLALLGVVIALLMLRRAPGLRSWLALAGILVVAGLVAQPLISPELASGPQAWRAIAYTPVCQERDGFEVCLHPAYETQLDATATEVAAMFGPVRGLAGVPDHWRQLDPTQGGGSEEPGVIDGVDYGYVPVHAVLGIFPVGGEFGPGLQRPASQLVIMEWLVARSGSGLSGTGWFGWPTEVPVIEQDLGNGSFTVGPDEAALAAFQPRMDASLERFAALPAEEQRAWLEANWDALRAGELTLDDLP